MTNGNRLARLQRLFQTPEGFFVWMQTVQAKGPLSEYWKFGTFVSWANQEGQVGFLYRLFFEVNIGVHLAADRSREIGSWASLFGLAMLGATVLPEIAELPNLMEVWRQRLCSLLEEVVALERAVKIIREVYFDDYEVLFSDVKTELASCHERTRLLIAGYNHLSEMQHLIPIDTDEIEEYKGPGVKKFIDQWVAIAQADDLLTRGRHFEARDVVISWLKESKLV